MYGMEYYLVVKVSIKYLNVKCWENKMVCVLYHSFVKFMLWKVACKSENSVKCESTKLSDNLRIISSSGYSFCFWSPTLFTGLSTDLLLAHFQNQMLSGEVFPLLGIFEGACHRPHML